MKHLFYLLTIFPILWEFINLNSPKKCYNFSKSLKGEKYNNFSSTQKTFSIYMIGYLLWVFIGLFSCQWILFLLILILSFIPIKYIWMQFINSLISIFVLLFILINEYHLHFNLYTFIFHNLIR